MNVNEPPEKIDKYQILSVLGKGAMGVVYHAYDPVVKRDVALKLLSSLGTEETELISRFEREARLAGGLRHPNIVTVYDLGNFQSRPYIVMEYIAGKDLQGVIKEKQPLTFEQRVEIILQICKGLEAAHQKGIIHRDIKPANIRLQEDNSVKIMDFGIARMGASQLTRSGYIIGTLQYMSPEQISGDQLDPRTDVFSTGVIAYELFTYANPFNGEHTVDIMYRILNVRPQPLENLPEEYGTELNQVIMRALEKNRELRYPSAREMSQELEEYLFYIKSLKFRRRVAAPVPSYQEGVTQTLPLEQMPAGPTRIVDPPTAPTAASSSPASGATYAPSPSPAPPSHPTAVPSPPPPPPAAPATAAELPATVMADVQNFPTYGMHVPERIPERVQEKAPRTGIGANYSETGQVLIKEHSVWQEKKFFILGAIVSLLFIGGLILTAVLTGGSKDSELTLASLPQGAEVYIDGRKTGVTPTTIEGRRDLKLVLKMPGYREKEISIAEKQWPDNLNVTLEPLPKGADSASNTPGPAAVSKNVQVQSTPAGATILMDGQELGRTPADIKLTDDKPHLIALRLDGYEPAEQTIDQNTSGPVSIELKQAQPDPGFVKYRGPGAVVILNGRRPVQGNPPSLAPGIYKLTFRSKRNAFIRFTKTVEVKSGETVVVNGPPTGTVTIKANPSNCKISIDGEFVDTAPIFEMPVQQGTHVISFKWETLGKEKEKTVTVESGQQKSVTGVPD